MRHVHPGEETQAGGALARPGRGERPQGGVQLPGTAAGWSPPPMDPIGPDGLDGCHPALELVEFKSGFSISIKCSFFMLYFWFIFIIVLNTHIGNATY